MRRPSLILNQPTELANEPDEQLRGAFGAPPSLAGYWHVRRAR